MKYVFKCVICEKECNVVRNSKQKVPSCCSPKCYFKKNKAWKFLSEEERESHLREYFEKNVIKKEGCWDWKKPMRNEKYIRMHYSRHLPKLSAHIYSWKLHNGPIPEGMFVCHKCDNPRCTNPDHLFLGTNYDNICDMLSKKRHPHGETHGMAKLTNEEVKIIRNRLSLGVSMNRLGRDFNVSKRTILRIKQNKTWKHV